MDTQLDISVVPFKHKYLPLLLEMLVDRQYVGLKDINMKILPKIGYICLFNNQPIAAGFLRRVEGGFAQIDGLTSNPYFGSKIRHIGISKVVSQLIEDAKDLKLNGLIGFTSDLGVIARAEDLGFHKVKQTIIALRLE